MANPALVVRVAANLEDIRSQMGGVSAVVQKAEADLRNLALGAGKTGIALGGMVERFSGGRIIADVLQMAEAVDRVGGVSRLTASEIREVGGAAAEARLKLLAMGQEVPPRIQALADAFGDVNNKAIAAAPGVNTLRGSLSSFDGVLSAMGINLSKEIRGINDLADASGKTAGQLGLLGTAGLVFGAGVAGWKVGRAVADFLDLDVAIGNATASLLGWGDVAGQEAGAKADTLALASERAGYQITSLSEAITINTNFAKGWTAEHDKATAALDAAAAATKALGLESDRIATSNSAMIRALNHELVATAAEKAAKSEAASLAATTRLWDQYFDMRSMRGVTTNETSIAQIERWKEKTIAAAVAAGAATAEFYLALEALSAEKLAAVGNDFEDVFRAKSIPALQETARNARETYNQMVMSGQFFRSELEAQLVKVKELEAEARGMGSSYVTAFEAAQVAAAKLLQIQQDLRAEERKRQLESRTLGGAFEVTSQNFEQALRNIATSGGWNPSGMGSNVDFNRAFGYARQGYSMEEIIAIFNRERAGGSGPVPPPQGPRIPGFGFGTPPGGAPGGWAMVGERGPEMMHVPRGASIYPHGSAAGGGTTIVNHFYITHPLGTPTAIWAAVEPGLLQAMREGGMR